MGSGKWYGVPNYGEYVERLLQQGPVREVRRRGADHVRRASTQALDAFKAKGITPLGDRRRRVPGAADLLRARAVQRRPRVRRRLPALQEQGRLPRPTRAEVRRRQLRRLGQEGLHRQELGRHQGRGHGRRLHAGKFPIIISGSLVVRPVRQRDQDSTGARSCSPATSCTRARRGNLWVVPTKAKTKTLAYDFIDITMRRRSRTCSATSGGLPVAADPSAITDPKNKELIENFNGHRGPGRPRVLPGLAGRRATTTCWSAGVQGLINESKTPDQVLDELAKPYNPTRPTSRTSDRDAGPGALPGPAVRRPRTEDDMTAQTLGTDAAAQQAPAPASAARHRTGAYLLYLVPGRRRVRRWSSASRWSPTSAQLHRSGRAASAPHTWIGLDNYTRLLHDDALLGVVPQHRSR